MKKKSNKIMVGYAEVEFISEIHFHELLDTEVRVGGQLLCVIAGTDIPAFLEALKKLIQEFKI
jgi:hypothetical protein